MRRAIIMDNKYDKSELQKAIKLKHAELNTVVGTAIEKGEKINEAEVMRISKELDLLINQYMKLTK
jgi:hypothetical protein